MPEITKPIFPKHWGNEPYENFYGSSSLAAWIRENQKKDKIN